MPGVLRPYTLTDVLGTLNAQNQAAQQGVTQVNAVGSFAEADETVPASDSATATHAAPNGWDAGIWGATQWQ
jgi:hypothetical protein